MEKRQQGFIYKIVSISEDFDEKDTYYGATFESLAKRMTKHRYDYRRNPMSVASHIVFNKYGIENCKIILLQTLENINKQERDAIEYEYISNNQCINKYGKSGLCGKSSNEYSKEYYQQNKNKWKTHEEIECVCGIKLLKNNLHRHLLTKKHQNI